MTTHRFFKSAGPAWLVGLALVCVAATTAGGFQLRVEVPQDDSDVVLLVRTYGCNEPQNAKISGTAEGLVEGRRVSVPVRLKNIDKGVFAIKQQWPAGNTWVLAFSGTYRGHHTSTLVTLDAQGKVAVKKTAKGTELDVRILPRKLSSNDIENALERLAHAKTTP